MRTLPKTLEYIDKSLEGRKYIVGDAISFADLQIFHELSTAEFGKFDISEYKNIAAYRENMLGAHPEIKKINEMFNETMVLVQADMGI